MKEVRLDGDDRIFKNLGDLTMGEVAVDTQNQRDSLLAGKSGDRRHHLSRALTTRDNLHRRFAPLIKEPLRLDRLNDRPLHADIVQADVDSNAIQPG